MRYHMLELMKTTLKYESESQLPWHVMYLPDPPISSAGLLGLLLIKASKASFMALMNPSLRVKQLCATLSILSLKSSRSCTMSLSFSGVHTISPPKDYNQRKFPPREYAFLRHKKNMFFLMVLLCVVCLRICWLGYVYTFM